MQPVNCAERRRRARQHGGAGESAERFAAEALPHLDQLYPAALRMTGDPSGAQELVIETYARACASLGQRGGTAITAWLFRNLADEAEETGLARPGDPVGQPERHEPPPEALESVPGIEVKDALERVPARSRLAVYLADVEGFSSSAIARILRLPASKVNSRLHRGRSQLRATLEARA